jgi:hypothetical protein
MKGITTYIYGLRRQGKVVYVGKSITPRLRFIQHSIVKYDDMIILDKFEDLENYWIKKLLSDGCLLENKETLKYGEDWEVGRIIKERLCKNKDNLHSRIPIRHIPSQKEFSSIKEAANEFGVHRETIRLNIHHKNPNKIKWEYI